MTQPLYLQLEYHVVHIPVQSPQRYQDRYPHVNHTCRKAHCGMVSAMDDGLANVTAALKATGMWENSIIVVTTDNGGDVNAAGACGANFPLRGGKRSFFAGGIQGVALIHSPSLLPPEVAGSTFNGLSHSSDWYPTLARRAGVTDLTNTGPFAVDGVDLWPFLSKARGSADPTATTIQNPHNRLLISGCRPGTSKNQCNGALIDEGGQLKLIVGKQTPAGWYGIPGVPNHNLKHDEDDIDDCSKAPCLFNLTADPLEKVNLGSTHPDLLQKMLDTFYNLSNVTVPQDPAPEGGCHVADLCRVVNDTGYFGPFKP